MGVAPAGCGRGIETPTGGGRGTYRVFRGWHIMGIWCGCGIFTDVLSFSWHILRGVTWLVLFLRVTLQVRTYVCVQCVFVCAYVHVCIVMCLYWSSHWVRHVCTYMFVCVYRFGVASSSYKRQIVF